MQTPLLGGVADELPNPRPDWVIQANLAETIASEECYKRVKIAF